MTIRGLFFLFILLICSSQSEAQISELDYEKRKAEKLIGKESKKDVFQRRLPEQDCNSAIPVCSGTFVQPNSFSGEGDNPNEVPDGSCLGSGELNSVWYVFTVGITGTLEFTIDPNDPSDDYDFALYDLTGKSCSDISTGVAPEVRCNYCLDSGPTGISASGVNASEDCCTNSPGCRYSSILNVTVGETFTLIVSNFTSSNSGYTLEFGGTAEIFDDIPAEPVSVITPCGVNFMDVQLNEAVLCSSISSDGSDFTLSGPGGPFTVTAATGINCGTATSQVNLEITPQVIIGGEYTITINNGADANTIIDNCENETSVGESLTFTATPTDTEIAGPNSVCAGSEITLTASSGTEYEWSNGEITQSITVSPLEQTTYSVTITSGTCIQNASTTVNVDPAPIANFSIPSSQICTGDNISFTNNSTLLMSCLGLGFTPCTPNGGECGILPCSDNISTNAWNFGDGGTSLQANPSHTFDDPGVYTVTLTVTDVGGGCTNVYSTEISVLPQSGVLNISDNTSICLGESTTLVASGGISFSWSSDPAGFSSNEESVEVSPSETTTYTVTSPGCNNDLIASVTVTVNELPNISVTPNEPTACPGNPVLLTASGALTYNWSPSDGLSSTTGATVDAQPSITTVYTVTGADANGCENISSVTVDDPIVLNIVSDGPTTICEGDEINLILDAGSGFSSYDWNSGADSQTINVTESGTFTVTVTNAQGCNASDEITIEIVNDITANAGADVEICSGTSIMLTASGGSNFMWSPSSDLSDASIANPIASPAVTTEYIVSVTEGTCEDQDTVLVEVLESPTINLTDNITIEIGESITLLASGGVTYSWSPTTFLNDPTIASPVSTPTETITYTVKVTDDLGCESEASVTIIVNEVDNCALGSLFIPTAFSPNGDGLNDEFFIRLEGSYDEFNFKIFNRWGEEVFYSEDLSKGWDGKYKGAAQSTDVLGYNLEVKCSEESVQKSGTITIIK